MLSRHKYVDHPTAVNHLTYNERYSCQKDLYIGFDHVWNNTLHIMNFLTRLAPTLTYLTYTLINILYLI